MLMYEPYIRKQLWHLRGQCVQLNPCNFEVHSSSSAGISPILPHEQTRLSFFFFPIYEVYLPLQRPARNVLPPGLFLSPQPLITE